MYRINKKRNEPIYKRIFLLHESFFLKHSLANLHAEDMCSLYALLRLITVQVIYTYIKLSLYV